MLDDAEAQAQLDEAAQLLTEAGFVQYLPRRWAKPGCEDKFWQGAANGMDVQAFGQSDYTRLDGMITTNTSDLNTYLEDMKTKPPQEIINSAYQIVNKQDLLMILESAEFTPAELNVLNELEHPLQVLYEEWLPVEDRHMEELRDSVQSYLDTRLQLRAEKLYADPSVFRYEGSYSEAREKGEVHLYRANRKRDRACIDAFTENISDANEARRMREFGQEWTQ